MGLYEITLRKNQRVECAVYEMTLDELEIGMEKAMVKARTAATRFADELKKSGKARVRVKTDRCGHNWAVMVWDCSKKPAVVIWAASGHVTRRIEE